MATATSGALSAADLERDDDLLADTHRCHAVADFDDFCDAFVSEV
jgi:hypothetical protein